MLAAPPGLLPILTWNVHEPTRGPILLFENAQIHGVRDLVIVAGQAFPKIERHLVSHPSLGQDFSRTQE
jgi:hypothetical protein